VQRESYRSPEILGRTAGVKNVRKFNLNLRPLKTLLYLGLLIFLIYIVAFGPYFRIKDIQVEGIKSVEVSDYLHKTLLGKNILFFLPGQYLNQLTRKFPILEQAKIVRGLPSTVLIVASERDQVLTWCSDVCFNIDNYGYAYEVAKPVPSQIPLVDKSSIKIEIGDKITTPNFINFYLNALKKTQEMGLKITEGRIEETSYKLILRSSKNYDIVFDTSESLNNQISALKQALEKNRPDIKEYADLRVEGLVYVK